MTTRYSQLVALVSKYKPKHIVEVGVHRGVRAALMMGEALRRSREVAYTGFDVFDTESPAFHEAALNGKGIVTQQEAASRLGLNTLRASVRFVVGDTRETLHKHPIAADFAFIDGDHRVEVIRGDAAAIDAPVLVFDDYYKTGPGGRCPDLTRYGANVVVEELAAAGRRVEILPAGDLCKHGGIAHLAVVTR